MTDKKISALTAATTPLAGTEVLPIVQAGATVKVAVSDLTAGRAITATSINKMVVTTPATSSTLTIADGKTLTSSNSLTLAGTDATTMTFPTTSATVARTDAANSFTGNQTLATGNLVIGTSGKGIDFSATPGTGTSELFTDYEEGTFTPTISGSTSAGTGTYAAQGGVYTKVGSIVNIQIYINVSGHTGTGNITITGLPFTSVSGPNNYGSVTIGYLDNCALTALNYPLGIISPNVTYISLVQSPTGGGALTAVPMDAAFSIMVSAVYRTA